MSARKNTILYVGGLESQVTEEILHSAFIPFGEIKSVQIPKDYAESMNVQVFLICFSLISRR